MLKLHLRGKESKFQMINLEVIKKITLKVKPLLQINGEEDDKFAGSDPKAGSTIQGTGFN